MRPADLPDFSDPPLNEVIFGVQFVYPREYTQIQAGQVWDLYKNKYPNIEEYLPLPPVFETFPRVITPQNFEFIDRPMHNRYWFLNESRDDLIQFQHDRLMRNWRKYGEKAPNYPRFEPMIEAYEQQLSALQGFFMTLSAPPLQVTQCEIAYVNHIIPRRDDMKHVSDWLGFIRLENSSPDGIHFLFNETIGTDGPKARLICEVNEGLTPAMEKMYAFTLTVRGAPEEATLGSAVKFIKEGRSRIVKKFAELTTPEAQKLWGRKK